MSNTSDTTKPATTIETLLPEVYRSEVNASIFGAAFDRHLTPDNTVRVAGYIGHGNPGAHVQRQIKEPTPHRQAYQLEPVMHTKLGTQNDVLTQRGFLAQLELMGVDINRLPEWGNTTQFNWIPPVNIDMLVNYSDYYWKPSVPGEAPQYFTIEGRCSKATSKVSAYDTILGQYGTTIPVYSVDVENNALITQGRYSDLLITDFIFYTKNTTDVNLRDKFWHVVSSTFDAATGFTTTVVYEAIAIRSDTAPTNVTQIGRWWYNTTSGELKKWDGTTWVFASSAVAVDISLSELRAKYQADADCACSGSYGWDVGQFDDNNTVAGVMWNEDLLRQISFPTEAEWLQGPEDTNNPGQYNAPNTLTPTAIWYDTSTDSLLQYTTQWNLVDGDFSYTIAETRGIFAWDFSKSCDIQIPNEWSVQNHWIHKSSVTSSDGIIRAQLPILEYGSTIEMNEWTEVVHHWKYRTSVDKPFESVDVAPTRFELEPIRMFVTDVGTEITITLEDKYSHDMNMSQVFVPGFRFRIVDAAGSETYVVKSSITTGTAADGMSTVVTLDGNTYSSSLVGDVNEARIEPLLTSNGDPFRGYHLHWVLDLSATEHKPCAPVHENFLLRAAKESPPHTSPDGNEAWSNYHYSRMLTTPLPSGSTITLPASLQYATTFSDQNTFALAGTELRVYINDVRQYGNYEETVATVTNAETYIGTDPFISSFTYVTGVTFENALDQYDRVRIEVAPAAYDDMGWTCVPVRMVESEALFSAPTYMSLSRFIKTEQSKTQLNQYPLFNVYDVRGELSTASPLFKYTEEADRPINEHVQRRIVSSVDGRDYLFSQELVDGDNGELYTFRNLYALKSYTGEIYWYDTFHNELKYWDDNAWVTTYINTTTGVEFKPVISDDEPTLYYGTLDAGALWFVPSTQLLYQYSGTAWVSIPVLVLGTDPLLQSIWRHGLNNEQYVPAFVDENMQPVTVGSADGDWETLDQWFYNSEHHNYQTVKYTELLTHLTSVVQQQPVVPGLAGSSAYTLSQNQYNYGLGGTIKEHNDSFDTLISAVNVTNVTPIGLIEFAEDQYDTLLLSVRDTFNRSSLELFADYSRTSLVDQDAMVVESVMEEFSTNDFAVAVYGDTTAYNASTGDGVRNWIVTVPIMGLGPVYVPHVIYEGGQTEIVHHDGHRTAVTYTPTENDKFARQLCTITDTRVSDGTLGLVRNAPVPLTHANFVAAYGGLAPRVGVYWYQSGSGVNQLYRFEAYAVSTTPPSTINDGAELPDGTMYYNSAALTTYEKQGVVWVPITADGAGDISPLWSPVSLQHTLSSVYYHIEQELYKVAAARHTVAFDYDTLVQDADGNPDEDAAALFDVYTRQRFDAYVAEHRIEAPMANVNYSASNAFSWNYMGSTLSMPAPRAGLTHTPQASWQALYDYWFGTQYPHLEPWCMQGYAGKPVWWDTAYQDTTSNRVWNPTMWTNILQGIVPIGYPLPTGTISTGVPETTTYTYLPVNSSSVTIAGGYAPDALLPPYYATVPGSTIRSLFTDLQLNVQGPDADYTYGDNGPTEWAWKIATEYVYDQLVIAFLMQPVKFFQAAFGLDLLSIDGLQVDGTTKRVYSHENVLFHGDVYDGDKQFTATGLNQWYVNYNRYSGYDTNTDFRQLWAGWTPHLGYQSASILDTSTLEIFSKYMDVGKQDYQVVLANTGVVDDVWADSFQVSVLGIPPAIIQYNNQNLWKFSVDTAASVNRDIEAYGVQHYPVAVNPATDTLTAFSFNINAADAATRRFYVPGNYQQVFVAGMTFVVSGTASNDGTYEVVTAVYETSSNRTRITVSTTITSSGAGGMLELNTFVLPWETGDMVFCFTTKMMPAPIYADVPYYVIKTGNRTFKLATSSRDAASGIAVDVQIPGQGDITVGRVASSFKVFGGASTSKETWYHFEIDRNTTYRMAPPSIMYGVQTVINMIDGYATLATDRGLKFNDGRGGETDPITGRTVSWQLEIERFINFLFGLRNTRLDIEDRYVYVVDDIVANTLTFSGIPPEWPSGQQVLVSTTGSLPTPLFAGATYYYVPGTDGTFTLSYTKTPTSTSIVNISSTGSGTLHIARYRVKAAFPEFEINPIRNNVWFNTPIGWLSDIIVGPYTDIRTNQTIFDQYGRPITPDKLLIFRQDRSSRVMIRPGIENDIEPAFTVLDDPYSYIHIGGCHLFAEGYEHIIMFEDYTSGGGLVYDSFVGLNTKKFEVDFRKSNRYTLRPSIGGFYLLDGNFLRNMEGSITDQRNMYDTFTVPELHTETKYARALLGYKGDKEYYDLVNLNSKSQFLFYRGMIQAKGSTTSVKAYINSRRFVDAKIDEYWAWKLADFGASATKVYPALKLYSTDGGLPEVRVEFADTATEISNVDTAHNFDAISFEDGYDDRWYAMPETRTGVEQSALFLNASVVGVTHILVGTTLLPASAFDYHHTSTTAFNYLHGMKCDAVVVIKRIYEAGETDPQAYTTEPAIVVVDGGISGDPVRMVNADIVKLDDLDHNTVLEVYYLGPSAHTNSPGALIDDKSETVLSKVQYWDPSRGSHSSMAIHNVDLKLVDDPALYTSDMVVATANNPSAWNNTEVGTRWLDTLVLDYIPYYDAVTFPSVDRRLTLWGSLADWAETRVFEWTSSTVPPTQWDAQSAVEESNTSIPAEYRATGNVRVQTYVRTRVPNDVDFIDLASGYETNIHLDTFAPGFEVAVDDEVQFTADTMPTLSDGTALEAETKYYVTTVNGLIITISTVQGGSAISFTSDGTNMKIVPSFVADDWKRSPLVRQKIYAAMSGIQGTITTINVDTTKFADGDVVDVYVNGGLAAEVSVVDGTGVVNLSTSITIASCDIIDVIRPEYIPTDDELEFNPDAEDDGTVHVQWSRYTPYTTASIASEEGDLVTRYYFWTENGITRPTDRANPLSLTEIEQQLVTIPTPYYIVQKPQSVDKTVDKTVDISKVFYRQAILRGATAYINDDNRYVWRFTNDRTLRDDLDNGVSSLTLKNKHAEWLLMRQEQPSAIPRELWDRLTESMVGYELDHPTRRVPALDRVLYDATYGTDTQYGLGADQSFVNGETALATVLAYLEDPEIDFSPMNIDDFFAHNDFSTPVGIAAAMDEIYRSFGAIHVNRMWFSTLYDAMTTKDKYRELFKTSWIALHGIRVLEVGGLFDD